MWVCGVSVMHVSAPTKVQILYQLDAHKPVIQGKNEHFIPICKRKTTARVSVLPRPGTAPAIPGNKIIFVLHETQSTQSIHWNNGFDRNRGPGLFDPQRIYVLQYQPGGKVLSS